MNSKLCTLVLALIISAFQSFTFAQTITVTQQPLNSNRCEGLNFTFSTDAIGTTNITFKWQKRATSTAPFVDLSDGGGYSGTSTKNLLITNVQSIHAGDYRCKIDGDLASTVYCNIASFTVNTVPAAPTVTNGTRCGPGAVTVTASGTTNGNYIWYASNGFSEPIPGENNSTYTATGLTASFTYYVSNGNSLCESPLVPVEAIINSVPAAPTAVNATNDGCGAQALTLKANASGSGTYYWYEDNSTSFSIHSDATGEFTTPVLSATTTYYVAFSNGSCESARVPVTGTISNSGPGTIDTSFAPVGNSTGNFSAVDDIEVQPDGKLILNYFETAGTDYSICRLLPNGTLDPSFTQRPRSNFTGRPDLVALQSDGKILSAGRFTNITGKGAVGRIVRLNADGSFDNTFNSTTPGFNGAVIALKIQADNKILAGGSFTSYNGTLANRIVRINDSNGSIDGTFVTGSGFNNLVNKILIRPDGKILVTGTFTTYNSVAVRGVVLLDSNGTLDTSFSPPSTITSAGEIALQADGKILIETNAGFMRLNANGTQDSSFTTGTGFNSTVHKIYCEPSGKIIVGGYFDSYDNTTRNFVARLNPNGSLDKYFDAGIGGNSWTFDLSPVGTNQLYVAGYFDKWNNQTQNGLAKINTECIRTPKGFGASICSGAITLTACGGFNGDYRWYTTSSGGTAIAGENNSSLTIPNLTATSTYYVSLNDGVCESARVPVVATRTAVTPTVTGAAACAGSSVTLSASGGSTGQYRWYSSSTGGTAISGETNSAFTTPVLSSTTTYYVSINNGTCEGSRVPVIATINPIPAKPTITSSLPLTGNTISVCSTASLTLSAPSGFANYLWSNGATTSQITVTTSGTYTVTVTNAGCTSPASDAIIVTVQPAPCNTGNNQPPVITPSASSVVVGSKLVIQLDKLLSDADNNLVLSSLRIVQQPTSGAKATLTGTVLELDYGALAFTGADNLKIEVCDASGACTQQTLTVDVVGDLIIYNALSPNGANPSFIIQYIELIPETVNNTVTIFDRWQNEVWKGNNYDNNSVVFKGTSASGSDLPTGTYFYRIDFASGLKSRTGFISLRR